MERNLYVYIGIIVLEILMCFVTAVAASCVVYEVWKSIKERSLPGKKFGLAAGLCLQSGLSPGLVISIPTDIIGP